MMQVHRAFLHLSAFKPPAQSDYLSSACSHAKPTSQVSIVDASRRFHQPPSPTSPLYVDATSPSVCRPAQHNQPRRNSQQPWRLGVMMTTKQMMTRHAALHSANRVKAAPNRPGSLAHSPRGASLLGLQPTDLARLFDDTWLAAYARLTRLTRMVQWHTSSGAC